MSYDRMKLEEKRLEKEIADLLKQAERADRSELAMGDWVTASPLVERQSPQ